MSPSNPPIPGAAGRAGVALDIPGGGGGAAGGAPPIPGGGGGGGAGGAPIDGIGGGGGGAAAGGSPSSKAPGIGGGGGGDIGPVLGVKRAGLVGLSTDFFSSIADSGLGGAIVPNRMDASCLALPPVGLSVSSSLSEDEVESTTDHSSSSGRMREGRFPVGVDVRGEGSGCDLAESCCWLSRWNGFVDSLLVFGEVIEEVLVAGSFIFLKNGFLVSAPNEDADGTGAGGGGAAGAKGGDCIGTCCDDCIGATGGLVGASDAAGVGCALSSLDRIWLLCGVIS